MTGYKSIIILVSFEKKGLVTTTNFFGVTMDDLIFPFQFLNRVTTRNEAEMSRVN